MRLSWLPTPAFLTVIPGLLRAGYRLYSRNRVRDQPCVRNAADSFTTVNLTCDRPVLPTAEERLRTNPATATFLAAQ